MLKKLKYGLIGLTSLLVLGAGSVEVYAATTGNDFIQVFEELFGGLQSQQVSTAQNSLSNYTQTQETDVTNFINSLFNQAPTDLTNSTDAQTQAAKVQLRRYAQGQEKEAKSAYSAALSSTESNINNSIQQAEQTGEHNIDKAADDAISQELKKFKSHSTPPTPHTTTSGSGVSS